MTHDDEDNDEYVPDTKDPVQNRSLWLRLFIIPLIVYTAWLIETFLLGGQLRLFQSPAPAGILVYTLVTCILIGLIVPVLYLRRSFGLGDVNMYQTGFRPAWRTGPIVLVTLIILLAVSLLFNPFGTYGMAFFLASLFLLPTATATVMVCFVLLGTHVQALMRGGRVLAAISSGVIVTAILFLFASLVRIPGSLQQDSLLFTLCTGIIIAVVFFTIRDIYATVLVATVCLVFGMAGQMDLPALERATPAIAGAACLSLAVLFGIHLYLSRKYATIVVEAA
ncbi:hypothetical protein [Methanoregula sp.]|uniref:hypothetical protein n=1 Tax=Methanoregula sp. TaxID=2052170 RepID=UPI0035681105